MKFKDIPIPERVAALKRTENGYPVLFTTAYIDGKPDLRVSDPRSREECFRKKLCGICGQKLDYWMFFVTGPLGVQNRTFGDPPMHKECLEYALQVCPYLGGMQMEYTADTIPGAIHDPTHVLKKPEKIGLYQTRGFKRVRVDQKNWLFLADAPFSVKWVET